MNVANGLSAIPADVESLEKSPCIPTQMLFLPLNIQSLNIITIFLIMYSWGVLGVI